VSCTVNDDKIWIHHYKPECKCQEYGMETPDVTSLKEVQIPTNIEKSSVHNVLEFASNNPWVLWGKGCNEKWCMLQWDASWQAKAGSWEYMMWKIVKRYYPAAWQCSNAAHFLNTPQAAVSKIRNKFHHMQQYF
jgi:hypothetical protein